MEGKSAVRYCTEFDLEAKSTYDLLKRAETRRYSSGISRYEELNKEHFAIALKILSPCGLFDLGH